MCVCVLSLFPLLPPRTTHPPTQVGVGLLDRETGSLRYFAEGREESIAVMVVGARKQAMSAKMFANDF